MTEHFKCFDSFVTVLGNWSAVVSDEGCLEVAASKIEDHHIMLLHVIPCHSIVQGSSSVVVQD